MTSSKPQAYREEVVRFGQDDALTGILSIPVLEQTELSSQPVLILGAGIIHKVGPSRVSVEVARFLASQGHTVLRFDLSGIGDSHRPRIPALDDAVTADIHAAIGYLDKAAGKGGGLVLVGFCSGADNAFSVAGSAPRVSAVAMFDPTVHRTRGFHGRSLLARLTSMRSWINLLSGRGVWARIRTRSGSDDSRPPGYYGLLVKDPAETDRHAAQLVASGVHLLYCMSGAAHRYCNSPRQIEESLPTGYSEEFISVAWRPDLDHILSRPEQQVAFCQVLANWMQSISLKEPPGRLGSTGVSIEPNRRKPGSKS